jgi:hypothetical protein
LQVAARCYTCRSLQDGPFGPTFMSAHTSRFEGHVTMSGSFRGTRMERATFSHAHMVKSFKSHAISKFAIPDTRSAIYERMEKQGFLNRVETSYNPIRQWVIFSRKPSINCGVTGIAWLNQPDLWRCSLFLLPFRFQYFRIEAGCF